MKLASQKFKETKRKDFTQLLINLHNNFPMPICRCYSSCEFIKQLGKFTHGKSFKGY